MDNYTVDDIVGSVNKAGTNLAALEGPGGIIDRNTQRLSDALHGSALGTSEITAILDEVKAYVEIAVEYAIARSDRSWIDVVKEVSGVGPGDEVEVDIVEWELQVEDEMWTEYTALGNLVRETGTNPTDRSLIMSAAYDLVQSQMNRADNINGLDWIDRMRAAREMGL